MSRYSRRVSPLKTCGLIHVKLFWSSPSELSLVRPANVSVSSELRRFSLRYSSFRLNRPTNRREWTLVSAHNLRSTWLRETSGAKIVWSIDLNLVLPFSRSYFRLPRPTNAVSAMLVNSLWLMINVFRLIRARKMPDGMVASTGCCSCRGSHKSCSRWKRSRLHLLIDCELLEYPHSNSFELVRTTLLDACWAATRRTKKIILFNIFFQISFFTYSILLV